MARRPRRRSDSGAWQSRAPVAGGRGAGSSVRRVGSVRAGWARLPAASRTSRTAARSGCRRRRRPRLGRRPRDRRGSRASHGATTNGKSAAMASIRCVSSAWCSATATVGNPEPGDRQTRHTDVHSASVCSRRRTWARSRAGTRKGTPASPSVTPSTCTSIPRSRWIAISPPASNTSSSGCGTTTNVGTGGGSHERAAACVDDHRAPTLDVDSGRTPYRPDLSCSCVCG